MTARLGRIALCLLAIVAGLAVAASTAAAQEIKLKLSQVLPEPCPPFKLIEVSKYDTEVSIYTTALAMFMNKAKFDSLPADVRKVLIETTAAEGDRFNNVARDEALMEVVHSLRSRAGTGSTRTAS